MPLALVIYAAIVWTAMPLWRREWPTVRREHPLFRWSLAVLGLVFLQILLGGFVAGLDAGLTYKLGRNWGMQGYAGYDLSAWVAIVAPKGTPPAVVNALNGAINAALALPEVNARLIEIGAEPAPGTAAELGSFMAKDAKVWAEVVKTAAIKVE